MISIFFDNSIFNSAEIRSVTDALCAFGEYSAAGDFASADVIITDRPHSFCGNGKTIAVFERHKVEPSTALLADDLMILPIEADELHARILRLIAPENRIFEKGELKIDFESAEVTVLGERIHLTLIEYRFLALLAKNHGRCVPYKEILAGLWECPIGNEMLSIRVFVNAIRRKFAVAGAIEKHIITHASKGYELI